MIAMMMQQQKDQGHLVTELTMEMTEQSLSGKDLHYWLFLNCLTSHKLENDQKRY